MKHINDSLKELDQEHQEIHQIVKEEYPDGYCISKEKVIEISKTKRGRPKKIIKEFPAAECVSCSV